jgi:hypothetical protein
MAKKKPKPPSAEKAREDFEYQLDVAQRIVTTVSALRAVNPTPTKPLHIKYVDRIVELAFMGAIASWEDFLEGCLVRYMTGAVSKNGYAPVLRLGPCDTVDHAYDVLSGEYDFNPAVKYMTWTNPKQIASLAKVFLKKGTPFAEVMIGAKDQLTTASKLRNRTAHASAKCRAEFAAAANRLRMHAKGTKLGKGTTVGSVLLESAGAFFGKPVPAAKVTVFTAYINLFSAAAQFIAPR